MAERAEEFGVAHWRRVAALVAVAMVAVGCGGATDGGSGGGATPDDDASTSDADGVAWDDAPASLGVLDPGVDVADEPAAVDGADFRTGEDGEELVVSDLVRTDASGFAEVRWVEGALARLDVDTLFEVTELDLTTGQPVVSTRLEVGRVWSRLDTGAADYEVTTDVGTAAVRGTGFLVSCLPTCTFGVAEGTLRVVTVLGIELDLRAGEQVAVDEVGTPGPIEPFDYDDPWVALNLDRDEGIGFPAIERVEPDDDDSGRSAVARGRMEGGYQFTFTVDESSRSDLEGQQVERFWLFRPDCDTGPCGGGWDPGDGGDERYTWTGEGYTASWVDRPAGECPDSSPRWSEEFVLRLTPTALLQEGSQAERGVIDTIDAVWESTLTPLQAALDSGCETDPTPIVQLLTGSGFWLD